MLLAYAMLVWAICIYIRDYRTSTARKRCQGSNDIIHVLLQTFSVGILAGPGAAVAFLTLRREDVLAADRE